MPLEGGGTFRLWRVIRASDAVNERPAGSDLPAREYASYTGGDALRGVGALFSAGILRERFFSRWGDRFHSKDIAYFFSKGMETLLRVSANGTWNETTMGFILFSVGSRRTSPVINDLDLCE